MKPHYLEAFCSCLIIGLGQIIKGEGEKGLVLLLLFYFALPAAAYLALILNGYLFLYTMAFAVIFGIILWLYNIWDALVRA
ncbi:MAG: hypothetical protein PHH60_00340 [Candidatus Margulisbacteria bacterium]|nr:hypothetical protein [Candidatus Margulisiibacteriota bacterium]